MASLTGQLRYTAFIDPIGELMEKLIAYMRNRADSKLSSGDGNPIMQASWLKSTMRTFQKPCVIAVSISLPGRVRRKTM